ncbi:redoxin domain-containing protein [Micrococcales bacterium 31B]|nr:redoxin domain-containing protein [Micrococcales bacterium 31B]
MLAPLRVGAPVPDFSLPDAAGARWSASDFAGSRVAFFFVPFAFTGVCTRELEWLRENKAAFVAADVEPLIVSCDARASQSAWLEALGCSEFTSLSDFWPHGAFARACGVLDEAHGYALRATVIVDDASVVRWFSVSPAHEERHLDEFLLALESV